MKRLIKLWFLFSKIAIQAQLTQMSGGILFIIGKVIRFGFYFLFLTMVLRQTRQLAGYNQVEIIWFFLVFNLVDIAVQTLFRGVYMFRPRIISGNFDLDLLQPLPSFFRPLFGWTDILDTITFIPLVFFSAGFAYFHHLFPNIFNILLFLLLFLNSLLIGFAFHIFIIAVGILTTEVDHLVWVYRDLNSMGRFPTNIYHGAVYWAITAIVPVTLFITFPAKALLGQLNLTQISIAVAVGIIGAAIALKFWFWSLRRYTSASS